MEPLENATRIDWRSNCYTVKYVSIGRVLDLFRYLSDLNPDIPIDRFAETWETVASEALEVMAEGKNLLQSKSFLSDAAKPVEVFPLLGGLTKLFCRVAQYRGIHFDDAKLWEFVECVHRWCCGDHIPEVLVRARGLFNIATTELSRVSARARIVSVAQSPESPGTSLDETGECNAQANVQKALSGESECTRQDREPAINGAPVTEAILATQGVAHLESHQTRLKAVVNAKSPYLILDGEPFMAVEVAVHYLNELIQANGRQVSFRRWLKENPKFEGAVVTRVLDGLPKAIGLYIKRSKGLGPCLNVELLRAAQSMPRSAQ